MVSLLRAARPIAVFPAARFELYQGKNFRSPMEEGISLYLYRVAFSTARRNLPARIDAQGKLHRRPLALDLHYMLTAWGRTPEMQHLLLGWAMRILEDTPTLAAGVLNADQPNTFPPDDTVDFVQDPLSVQDMTYLWEVSETNREVSTTYVARMVPIDSLVEVTEAPPVQTRLFDVGQNK